MREGHTCGPQIVGGGVGLVVVAEFAMGLEKTAFETWWRRVRQVVDNLAEVVLQSTEDCVCYREHRVFCARHVGGCGTESFQPVGDQSYRIPISVG
jgi:hypothetical protein